MSIEGRWEPHRRRTYEMQAGPSGGSSWVLRRMLIDTCQGVKRSRDADVKIIFLG